MFAVSGVVVLVFLLVFGLVVVGTIFWVWALIDLLRRPDQQFVAAGQNKIVWLLLVLFLHLIGSLLYLFIAKPQLDRVVPLRY